jgi:dUTP pyrophosphatase
MKCNYLLEPTAPDAPSQNGLAERPNQSLGAIVRCLLHAAGLGSEYWSFALLHATYLKNHLPHQSIECTPYQKYTGRNPTPKHLRIFGCPAVVRNLGKLPHKLDMHASTGTFLGYTITDKNIIYIDKQTHHIKTATHCTFDEAAITIPPNMQPAAQQALHSLGYITQTHTGHIIEQDVPHEATNISQNTTMTVNLLTPMATLPQRATKKSAGYDVYSACDTPIPPHTHCLIPLDIQICPPMGTYAQILFRSGHATKHCIDVKAGVIDPDYRGNVQVLLHNDSDKPFQVNVGDRIAQLVLINIETPTINSTKLNNTAGGNKGFGSTGEQAYIHQLQSAQNMQDTIHPIKPAANLATTDQLPYNIYMSQDPFDNILEITIPIKGDHPTLGMILQHCPHQQQLQLYDMLPSTPGSRIPKWRSTLRNSY